MQLFSPLCLTFVFLLRLCSTGWPTVVGVRVIRVVLVAFSSVNVAIQLSQFVVASFKIFKFIVFMKTFAKKILKKVMKKCRCFFKFV